MQFANLFRSYLYPQPVPHRTALISFSALGRWMAFAGCEAFAVTECPVPHLGTLMWVWDVLAQTVVWQAETSGWGQSLPALFGFCVYLRWAPPPSSPSDPAVFSFSVLVFLRFADIYTLGIKASPAGVSETGDTGALRYHPPSSGGWARGKPQGRLSRCHFCVCQDMKDVGCIASKLVGQTRYGELVLMWNLWFQEVN